MSAEANTKNAPNRGEAKSQLLVQSPKVGRVDAMKSFFVNYSNFKGRAVWAEFWFPVILVGLVSRLLRRIADGFAPDDHTGLLAIWIFEAALAAALVTPLLAVGARRLHDTGRSAKLLWLLLLPGVGALILVIFWFGKSQRFDNPYGPNPWV